MLFKYVRYFKEYFLLIWSYMPIETIRESLKEKKKSFKSVHQVCET